MSSSLTARAGRGWCRAQVNRRIWRARAGSARHRWLLADHWRRLEALR
jgi:hypothetical protein